MKKKIMAAGIIGEILEWYDFTLYGFLAPILASLFFPLHTKTLSLLATFGGFAAGYLMRPVGGFLFGHFGDRYGRKKVLAATLLCMAVPTFLMGFLPSYAVIGFWAPILLIILRMLQGISCGGEYTGSIIFLYENAAQRRQGFYASLAIMGSFIGALLSIALIGILSAKLSHQAFLSWGWRIPFVLGIVTAIIGFYIRMKVNDTPVFEALKCQNKLVKIPIKNILLNHKKKLLIILAFNIHVAVLSYIILIYMPTYLTSFLGIPLNQVMMLNLITILTIIVTIPLIGLLVDKIGSKTVLIFATLTTILLSYPIFTIFSHKIIIGILTSEIIFGFIIASSMIAAAKSMTQLAPASVRYSCVSVGHGLCDSIFGGSAPLVAMYLMKAHISPSYYIILAALMTLLVAFKLKRNYYAATDDDLDLSKI